MSPVLFGSCSLRCQFRSLLFKSIPVLTKILNLLSSCREFGFFVCQSLFHVCLAVFKILYLLSNLLTDGIAILLEFTQRSKFLFEVFLILGKMSNHRCKTLMLGHCSSQFLVQIVNSLLQVVSTFFK